MLSTDGQCQQRDGDMKDPQKCQDQKYCNRNKCFDGFINRLDRTQEGINEAEDWSIETV